MPFKNAFAYTVIGFMALLSLLPLRLIQTMGALLGFITYLSNAGPVKAARINITRCLPELNTQQQKTMLRNNMINLGVSSAELATVWFWSSKRLQNLITEIDGVQHLQNALDNQQGLILISPHLGNWEILTHGFRPYLTMTAMYKPAKIPALDGFIKRARIKAGVKLAPANAAGVKQVLKALIKKEVIGVLPDQEPNEHGGVFSTFFKHPALTMKLVGDLAHRTQAAALFCYAIRLNNGRFKMVVEPADADVYDADPQIAADALNRSIEACVRRHPEQYLWSYKRFRKQPNGQPSPYRKAA